MHLVNFPLTVAISRLVNSLKGVSSRRLRQELPRVRNSTADLRSARTWDGRPPERGPAPKRPQNERACGVTSGKAWYPPAEYLSRQILQPNGPGESSQTAEAGTARGWPSRTVPCAGPRRQWSRPGTSAPSCGTGQQHAAMGHERMQVVIELRVVGHRRRPRRRCRWGRGRPGQQPVGQPPRQSPGRPIMRFLRLSYSVSINIYSK